MAKASEALKLALEQPDFAEIRADKSNYITLLYNGLFYVHNVVENRVLKKETLAVVSEYFSDIDVIALKTLSDGWFDSVGKFCYMISNGAVFTEKEFDSIEQLIRTLAEKAANRRAIVSDVEEVVQKPKTIGIQDYMREKAGEVCSEFEVLFDAYSANPGKVKLDLSPKSLFRTQQLKSGHLRYVIKFYEPMVVELSEALKEDDSELREAYGFLTKPQLRRLLDYVKSIVDDAQFLKDASVTNRKPRKKKAVDVAKVVSKLKFLEKDDAHGLTSERPVHIVGAKEVWVFNTKTRKLGRYFAFDDAGLQVKGTSIKNFTDKSAQRTVRKGVDFDLKKFISGNKSGRNREFKELKGIETKLNGRTNAYTIILKIER